LTTACGDPAGGFTQICPTSMPMRHRRYIRYIRREYLPTSMTSGE